MGEPLSCELDVEYLIRGGTMEVARCLEDMCSIQLWESFKNSGRGRRGSGFKAKVAPEIKLICD